MSTIMECCICHAPWTDGHRCLGLSGPLPASGPAYNFPKMLTESDVRRIVREELASKNSWLIECRPDSGEADV